jgi:hypothetical protein
MATTESFKGFSAVLFLSGVLSAGYPKATDRGAAIKMNKEKSNLK